MDHLRKIEATSIHILREAYANFRSLAMLWSIGKDSTVMLWLARKAFLGHVPFPLVHIDTNFKIPEMIDYRQRIAKEWGLSLIVGQNREALVERQTFPHGSVDRIRCCSSLKTMALQKTLSGEWPRQRYYPGSDRWEIDSDSEAYTGVIVGVRADEEGSRSKERYFSVRNSNNHWEVDKQAPEFWNHYKTDFAPGTHVRIHPLLDWTELDIWAYIEREGIPVSSLYFARNGKRHRSLGCAPCTQPIDSEACTVKEIIAELKSGQLKNISERSGRAQDAAGGGGLEALRREGYM